MKNTEDVKNCTANIENIETHSAPKAPDGGWGWMVVLSSFAIHVVADGVTYAYCIFYEEFLKEFKESKAKTSVVSSVMFSACLLSGIGFGLMYMTAIVCVTLYFEERRTFATGISMSGTGIGSCAMSPLTQWMVDLMGWRTAMLIVAGIVLTCSVFGYFFRPLKRAERRRGESTMKSQYDLLQTSLCCLAKNKAFVIYALSNCFLNFGINVPRVYFENFVSENHIANADEGSYLLAIVGISNTVGTFAFGYISNRSCVNKFWVYFIGNSLCGLATALCCLCTTYTSMALYATIFGITSGANTSLYSVILVDTVGLEFLMTALGVSFVFDGIFCLIGPPIIGLVYDYTGSYCLGFLLSGSAVILSGLMVSFIPCHLEKAEST